MFFCRCFGNSFISTNFRYQIGLSNKLVLKSIEVKQTCVLSIIEKKRNIGGHQIFSFGKYETEIKFRLNYVFGNFSSSFSTVNFWVSKFKRNRIHASGKPRSRCPEMATTPEIVDKIHDMILADRRIKLREIEEAVGISYKRKVHTLHNGFKKTFCKKGVSEQKYIQARISAHRLEVFERSSMYYKRRFMTMDETWIHHYISETKMH